MKTSFFKNSPCKNCPWKRSSRAGGQDIPNFDIELMRGLASTAPPKGSTEDDFRQVFSCHETEEGKDKTCAGYLARDGQYNINIRLLSIDDKADIQAIIKRAESFPLYDNFHEMLEDYENNQ